MDRASGREKTIKKGKDSIISTNIHNTTTYLQYPSERKPLTALFQPPLSRPSPKKAYNLLKIFDPAINVSVEQIRDYTQKLNLIYPRNPPKHKWENISTSKQSKDWQPGACRPSSATSSCKAPYNSIMSSFNPPSARGVCTHSVLPYPHRIPIVKPVNERRVTGRLWHWKGWIYICVFPKWPEPATHLSLALDSTPFCFSKSTLKNIILFLHQINIHERSYFLSSTSLDIESNRIKSVTQCARSY